MKRSKCLHIVMLLYGSLPIDTRVDREIGTLVKKKHNITILDTEMGHGKWKGYKGAKRIPIIRLPTSKRQSVGGVVRFWYACFKYLYRSRESIDVVHVHDLTGLPPAWLITTMVSRIRFVYDAHELFPEAALDRISVLHCVMFLTIEMICASRIDYLIAVSPVALRKIARRVGGTPVLLMNVPDLLRVQEKLGEIPRWSRKSESSAKRIVYSGGVLHHRGYNKLVEAAKILTEDVIHKYEFWIVGDGPYLDHVKSIVESLDLSDSFVFTGRVDFEELLNITSRCDIAVALYSSNINSNLSLSNKIFEYMMLGMPIIFSDLAQSRPILKRISAFILDNPLTVENLVQSIISLSNDCERMTYISTHGRRLVLERFNWQMESQKLIRIYESLYSSIEQEHIQVSE